MSSSGTVRWKVTAVSATGNQVVVDADKLLIEVERDQWFTIQPVAGAAIGISTDVSSVLGKPSEPDCVNRLTIRPAAGNFIVVTSVRVDLPPKDAPSS